MSEQTSSPAAETTEQPAPEVAAEVPTKDEVEALKIELDQVDTALQAFDS